MSREMSLLPRFPHVMIVEASAGSGKTYTLAKRYLQLLINPTLDPRDIPIRQVLAVTFTNKAALEMKERILDFLKKIALDCFRDEDERRDILSSLGVPQPDARAKARLALEEILRSYNYFQIKTIDSLINGILSGCAFKLDLSAYFRTDPSHEQYLSYCVDLLIDAATKDAPTAQLFKAFLRQYLFIERKSGWFPRQDIINVVSALFSKNNMHAGDFSASEFDIRQEAEAKRQVLQLMRRLEAHLPEMTHVRFAAGLRKFLAAHTDGFSIDDVSDYFGRDEFPVRQGGRVPAQAGKLWNGVRQGLREVCELEAMSVFNAYVTIFSRVIGVLKEATRRDDVLFLEALNKEANLLLAGGQVSLPELYYRLATRFRHLLVDEFQDTSLLQWENFQAMALEALASGGSLFYVGDRKQAIYRFRGGDVGFIDVVKDQLKVFPVIEETLCANYRSAPQIVRFNNEVFCASNLDRFIGDFAELKKDDEFIGDQERLRIKEVFGSAVQDAVRRDRDGLVDVRWIDNRTRDELYPAVRSWLLETVADCRTRYACSQICVAVRTNEEVERVTGWLHAEGIPVASEKTLDIRLHPCIKELLSFLRFLHSPVDNIAFASFVLGGIFRAAARLELQEVRDFLFRQRCRKDRAAYLYREFRNAYPAVWDELIEPFFTSVGFVPLYELVISMYHRYGVMAGFARAHGFFMHVLELIIKQEERHAGIGAFLEYLEQAPDADFFVKIADADAVRVLTVHKAKGLEFPVVAVPFAELNVKPDQDIVVGGPPGTLRLVRLRKRYGVFSRRLCLLQKAEFGRALLDELNTVYVALTRARDELHVSVPQRAESGPNPARLLLPAGRRGTVCQASAPPQTQRLRVLTPSVHGDWIAYLKEGRFDRAYLRRRDVRLTGECMHAVLAGIGNLVDEDQETTLSRALASARRNMPGAAAWERIEERVRSLLNEPGLSGIWKMPGALVRTEQEIVTLDGRTQRVDRLLVSQNEVTVVDFKSSRENHEESVRQVQGYLRSLRRIYGARALRGMLVYFDTLDSEEVTAV